MLMAVLLSEPSTTSPEGLARACGVDASLVCEIVYNSTSSEATARTVDWIVAKPVTIILIVVVAIVANRILRRIIVRTTHRLLQPPSTRAHTVRIVVRKATPAMLLKAAEVNIRTEARVRTLTTVFRSLTTAFVWAVAVFAILGVLGVSLAPLLASAGLIGVALGFGAQNVVRDFTAGIFLVIEDQFGVGDIVDLGEAKGTVEEITLRATSVRDVHGSLWHVPNGQILRVANKSQAWARAVLDIEVDVDTDYDRAAAILQSVADELTSEPEWKNDVIGDPEVWGIEAFTAEGYTIRLVIKTQPASQFGVMRELRIRLRAAFTEHGIFLPAERPELWVHDASAATDSGAAADPEADGSAAADPEADGGAATPASAARLVEAVQVDPVRAVEAPDPVSVARTGDARDARDVSGVVEIGSSAATDAYAADAAGAAAGVAGGADAADVVPAPALHPKRGDPSEG